MEAIPSSAAIDAVVRAIAPPDAAGAGADWSGLPEDLLLIVMAALDLPNLISSAAVCTSWRDACKTFGLPVLKQAPCLLYACEQYGSSDAALYCPSTDATFRVPFPGPPHDKRGFVFSCNGWVFAADEVGNPYLFNPMTGVQSTLPPVKTIMCREENFYNDDGEHLIVEDIEDGVSRTHVIRARHSEYVRVAISPAAEVGACTVLMVHEPCRRLSFARPGDKRWTLLSDDIPHVSNVLYNANDGLFYILHTRGSISTLDLSGPSPSMATIMDHVTTRWMAQLYLALTPSGELLQVWRMQEHIDIPLKARCTRQDVRERAIQNCIEFADEDGSDKLNLERNSDDEEDGLSEVDTDERVSTTELLVFKVDIDRKKLVEIRDIGDQALFLGFNAAVCLPIKDLSPFEPNSAYLTDDGTAYGSGPMSRKDLCIWNIKKRSMQNLVDAWPNLHSWLDLPAPIWITPRF
ncbi:hypothetical protein ACQ4PT_026674 [Festuca glaucescens]